MPELDNHDSPLPTTTVKWRFPSVHPEGRKFVVGAAFATLLLYWLWHPLGWLAFGLTLWVAAFFRDPIRTTPRGDKFIVAPADGLITMIAKVPPDLSRYLIAPMPGLLTKLDVAVGDKVEPGQPVAVMEAMKMENILRAPKAATVKATPAKAGDSVAVDQVIVEFE